MKKSLFAILILAAVLLLASAPAWSQEKGPIVVGSKIDTEGSLLGEMIVLLLRAHGFTVTDRTSLGPTNVVRQALLSGEIDIYPEYTGNGGYFFPNVDPSVWKNPQKGYETVKKLDKEQNHVIWLQPAPADNTWAIAVTKKFSKEHNMTSLADMAAYVNGGGRTKLAGSEEFVSRAQALPSFEKAYGFSLRPDQLVILSGGNTALTEKALADGTDGVNFAMAYGTDGGVAALGETILADPRHVQPVYEPTPIIRESVLDRYPQIAQILDPPWKTLTTETLQSLNAKIAVGGEAPASVARAYLVSKGFLK
jgi:osmoprotectant transport system substrate-binding protein